jgi:hypothetical protein
MSLAGTNYPDIHGGEYRRDRQNFRRTKAVRRGLYRATGGLVAAGGQNQLKQLADAFVSGGPSHPSNSALPLATVSVRRIGADLFEYELGYGLDTSNTGPEVQIFPMQSSEALVPFANEVDSGLRWTSNRVPPLYAVTSQDWIVSKSRTFNSISGALAVINTGGFNASTDVGKVNNASYSVGGVSFATGTLKYEGVTLVSSDSEAVATMRWRFVGLQYPTHANAPTLLSGATGHGYGTYRPITQRPYWQGVWSSPPSVAFPTF